MWEKLHLVKKKRCGGFEGSGHVFLKKGGLKKGNHVLSYG